LPLLPPPPPSYPVRSSPRLLHYYDRCLLTCRKGRGNHYWSYVTVKSSPLPPK
jgi:hypothetical protein